jgi:hypothetical protein
MSRFWGTIGLNKGFVETAPGVHAPNIVEVQVNGEMRNLGARVPNANQREGVSARHVLSIVDPDDSSVDFTEAVYVVWQNRKWAIVTIEYKRPRVELSLGGMYNG